MNKLKEIREALVNARTWISEDASEPNAERNRKEVDNALNLVDCLEAREAEAPKVSFNEWWLSLSDGQRSAWMQDKWRLADIAFQAGARIAAERKDSSI